MHIKTGCNSKDGIPLIIINIIIYKTTYPMIPLISATANIHCTDSIQPLILKRQSGRQMIPGRTQERSEELEGSEVRAYRGLRGFRVHGLSKGDGLGLEASK